MLITAKKNQQHVWTTTVHVFTVLTVPHINSQLWAMIIAMFAILPHIASLKMDSKFGDLSNKIAEMHPIRNGAIVTLRQRMHNNACLAIIPRPTCLLAACHKPALTATPCSTDARWLHTEIPSSSQPRRDPTKAVVTRHECCYICHQTTIQRRIATL